MTTVSVKDKFCDSGFKIFEEPRVVCIFGGYKIPTVVFTVRDPPKVLLVKIDVVYTINNVDLKIIHNLLMLAKTYYSSSYTITSSISQDVKSALQVFPKNSLVQYFYEGHNKSKIQTTRKKPPHRFDPILPYWAFNTRTRRRVRAQFL